MSEAATSTDARARPSRFGSPPAVGFLRCVVAVILGLLFGAPVAILVGGIALVVRSSFGVEFGSYAPLAWAFWRVLIVWGLATILGGAWAVVKWRKENRRGAA